MLYTICAIVRRRLEQEQDSERRETILGMLDLLESPGNLTKAHEPRERLARKFSLRSGGSQATAASGYILSSGLS